MMMMTVPFSLEAMLLSKKGGPHRSTAAVYSSRILRVKMKFMYSEKREDAGYIHTM